MPKPELGTKRICPATGHKFYDLNRDPIVSPYTRQTYPLTFFEGGETVEEKEEPAVEADTAAEEEAETSKVEIVSLEDADEEASDTGETIQDIDGDDDDVSGIIAVSDDDEET